MNEGFAPFQRKEIGDTRTAEERRWASRKSASVARRGVPADLWVRKPPSFAPVPPTGLSPQEEKVVASFKTLNLRKEVIL